MRYNILLLILTVSFYARIKTSNQDDEKQDITRSFKLMDFLRQLELKINSLEGRIHNVEKTISLIQKTILLNATKIETIFNSFPIEFDHNKISINNIEVFAESFDIINGAGTAPLLTDDVSVSISLYLVTVVGTKADSIDGLLIIKAKDSNGIRYSRDGDFTYVNIVAGNTIKTTINTVGNAIGVYVEVVDGIITLVA